MVEYSFKVGPGCGRHPDRHSLEAPRSISPTSAKTLLEALEHWNQLTPNKTAFHFVGIDSDIVDKSFREVWENSRRYACLLQAKGIKKGDRVLLALETSPELLESFLGCQWLGAIPCIVDPVLGKGGLERIKVKREILKAQAVVAVTKAIDAMAASTPDTVLISPEQIPGDHSTLQPTPPEAEDLAFIQFTSGTTSRPRGVCISHRALMANVACIAEQGQWNSNELMVGWLPLFHDMGLVATTLSTFCHGLPVALMSPMAFLLEPARWLWAIHYFRGTLSFSPNFGFQLCVKRKDPEVWKGLDLSSWKNSYNAAEFIHRDTVESFLEETAPHGFKREFVLPAYGLAEFVVGVTCREPGSPLSMESIDREALNSEGRILPLHPDDHMTPHLPVIGVGPVFKGHDVRIIDEQGADVGERQQGEILLRGPSLASGYFEDPLATAATFRDGWLHTGDLGYLVGNELFISGRKKDLIIRSGENVHPYHLELAAGRVEGVREGCVAAVSIDNLESGTEDIVVVFETKEQDEAKLRTIRKQVKEQIYHETGIRPDYTYNVRPRHIPKTSSGKICRRIVKDKMIPALMNQEWNAGTRNFSFAQETIST